MQGSRRVLWSPTEAGGGQVGREIPKLGTAQEFKDILAELGFDEGWYRKIMEEGNPETIRLLVALHAATDSGAWSSPEAQAARYHEGGGYENIPQRIIKKIKGELGEERFGVCEADLGICVEAFSVPGYDLELTNRMIRAARYRGYDTDDPFVRAIIVMSVKKEEGEGGEKVKKFLVRPKTVSYVEESACGPVGKAVSDHGKIVQDWNARQGRIVPARAEAPSAGAVPSRAEEEVVGAPRPEREYPAYIVDKTIQDMIATFNEETSEFNLEKIQLRAEYLAQKGSSGRTASEEEEVKELRRWIKEDLGFPGYPMMNAIQSISEMRVAFFTIQSLYYDADEGGTELIRYMKQIRDATNENLFNVYKKYLSELDENAGKLFIAVDPRDPKYLYKIGEAMRSRLSEENVGRGMAAWGEYFREFSRDVDPEKFSHAMQYALSRVGTLSPLLAASFYEYLNAVQSSDLSSPEERNLVVRTAAQLYAVNPLLVGKYFQAITNLAKICEDNSLAFRNSMAHLSAKIEAVAKPVVDQVMTALQFDTMNVRTIVTRLSNALDEVTVIPPAALSQYDRFNLADDFVRRWLYMPHPVMQERAKYMPGFLIPPDILQPYEVVYPFPEHLMLHTPMDIFSMGSVITHPEYYRGGFTLPMVRPLQAVSHVDEVKSSLMGYLWDRHTMVSFADTIPGVSISGLSPTRLLMEIDRAFIPTDMPQYSMRPLGGSLVAGVMGEKNVETGEKELGGGGMGSYITPTGGIIAGGGHEEERTMGAGAMVGVPVYKVREEEGGRVGGVDSLIAGYEKSGEQTTVSAGEEGAEEVLTEEEERLLVEAIATKWNPTNPGQAFITVNSEKDYEGKKFTSVRTFYMEKDGTIYELMGAKSDYIDAHNFIAWYGNQNIDLPVTYAGNVEPTIERGGGAVAWDAGAGAGLVHTQAVPFYTTVKEELGRDATPEEVEAAREAARREKPMPLLIQWTPAGAWTKTEEKEARIHIVSAPGSGLELEPSPEDREEGRMSDRYIIQDVRYRLRYIKEKRAWELSTGAGLGGMKVAREGEEEGRWEEEKKWIGRGGIFLKTQSREERYSRAGGGAYYEGGATNMMALALMNEAEEERRYIESLHRIGVTVYGGGKTSSDLVMGGLMHVLEQWRELGEGEEEEGPVSPPDFRSEEHEGRMFYRLIAIFKGLQNISKEEERESEWGVKMDIIRHAGMERILTEYEGLAKDIQSDPGNAASMMNRFRERNVRELRQIFDQYSLAVQVTKNFSLRGVLAMRERGNQWVKQDLDRVHMKQLWTFRLGKRFGFQRAWASVPMLGRYLYSMGQQRMGLIGAGMGMDLFTGKFLNRAAFDLGLVFGATRRREDLSPDDRAALEAAQQEWEESGREGLSPIARFDEESDKMWEKQGKFVQGAISLFDSMMENSNPYRNLVADAEEMKWYIRAGNFSKLRERHPGALKRMCDGLDPKKNKGSGFNSELLKRIRRGENIPVRYGEPKKGAVGLGPEEIANIEKMTRWTQDYIRRIRQGKISEIPEVLWPNIAEVMEKAGLPEWMTKKVAEGKNVQLNSEQIKDIEKAIRKEEKEYESYIGKIRQGTFKGIPKGLLRRLIAPMKAKNFPDWAIHRVASGKNIPLKRKLEGEESGWLSEFEVRQLEDSLWLNDFSPKKDAIQKKFDGHFRNWRNYYAGSIYDLGPYTNWDVGTFVEWMDGIKHFRLYGIYSNREDLMRGGRQQLLFAGARLQLGKPGKVKGDVEAVTSILLDEPRPNFTISTGVTFEAGGLPMGFRLVGYHRSTRVADHVHPCNLMWPAREYPTTVGGVGLFFTVGKQGQGASMMTGAPAVPEMGQRR